MVKIKQRNDVDVHVPIFSLFPCVAEVGCSYYGLEMIQIKHINDVNVEMSTYLFFAVVMNCLKIDGRSAKIMPSVDWTCKGVSPLKTGAVIMGVKTMVLEKFWLSSWWFVEIWNRK